MSGAPQVGAPQNKRLGQKMKALKVKLPNAMAILNMKMAGQKVKENLSKLKEKEVAKEEESQENKARRAKKCKKQKTKEEKRKVLEEEI